MDILYIVIPCYNEQEVLPETSRRVGALLRGLIESGRVSAQSRILFVDDGSRDSTWSIISGLHNSDPIFSGLKLSRNRGHQNALLAGLLDGSKKAHLTISMDADLQDDPNAVLEMLDKYAQGCEIVYGVRAARKTDTAFKRFTAESFYRLIKSLGGDVVFNHADYRLLGRRALNALEQYRETNLFLRGIIPMLGYKSDIVYYERSARFAGESKYPLRKMLAFAVEGITSLSAKPLKLVGAIGAALFALGLLGTIVFLCLLQMNLALICSVWGASGLVLTALGVIGEYIGKIYIETKHRPRYFPELLLDSPESPTHADSAPADSAASS
ncbi:MAG: glycosyltransferase family 2 protein [Oscillospiraceae bacterium]|jgi:glycosyltransferase involved in cell wall biosynthesis|nr:glycosyltransferase family 2 protein [Oscillospiraceae bacterium]